VPIDLSLVFLLAGICAGLLAVPIHQQIRLGLERTLPNAPRADVARNASDAILRTLDGEQLPNFLAGAIAAMLRPTHVTVFSRDPVTSDFIHRSSHWNTGDSHQEPQPARLRPDDVVIGMVAATHDLLDRSRIRRFHSLSEAQSILAVMREFDAELVAPILWEDHLIGLVIIGEKLAGDMYTREELQMLRTMLPQISLAVRNAQLYDEMAQMKETNETILRQMKSGVIAVSATAEIVLMNPAAEATLGLSAHQAVGRPAAILPAPIAGLLDEALAGAGRRREDRFVIRTPDGREVPVACSASVWHGTPLTQEGAIAVVSDLTLVEELERKRLDAEHLASIRMLSAGMAHELRNPLVAIRTFAELLPTRWTDQEFRVNFLKTAHDEIERIDRLLTELLLLSKPAGVVVESVNVNEVCAGVLRAMSARAESAGIHLDTELASRAAWPLGDKSRLHQALLNLVKNAVEAEPVAGRVEMRTRDEVDADGRPVVVIAVHNDHSFIAAEELEIVFQPFYSKRPGGTGLGLAICQTIIEEHDGRIVAQSSPLGGTDFIIHLPLPDEDGDSRHAAGTGI
jgi:PAS domain S-box-containing protein